MPYRVTPGTLGIVIAAASARYASLESIQAHTDRPDGKPLPRSRTRTQSPMPRRTDAQRQPVAKENRAPESPAAAAAKLQGELNEWEQLLRTLDGKTRELQELQRENEQISRLGGLDPDLVDKRDQNLVAIAELTAVLRLADELRPAYEANADRVRAQLAKLAAGGS